MDQNMQKVKKNIPWDTQTVQNSKYVLGVHPLFKSQTDDYLYR